MNLRRTVPLLAALAALAALSLSACGGPDGDPAAERRPGTTVRAALNKDPASLSLLGKMDLAAEILAVQLTDSLVQYDADLELRPRVAESWEFSADRRTLTFRLREGVRWHDGRPVTAEDVVFTVETVREPAVENRSYGPSFRGVTAIEAVDPRTVRVQYAAANAGVLESWRLPLIPRHLAGGEDLLTGAFARRPVGCGPFRFVAYLPGQEIVLEANDDYWDGRPHVDRLLLKIYPDRQTAYQALIRGDLDILTVSAEQWLAAQESAAADRLDVSVYSTLAVWPIVWNQDGGNPFFTDARVRQAMIHALDRETFIATVARGQARAGATTFHPDTPWADPAIRPRPYDPQRARKLLAEAGWIDRDGDGTRERDGRPFRFTLLLPQSSMQLVRLIAEWQQDSWREIGVAAEIEQLEWQAFRELRNAGRFEAASFSLLLSPDPDQFFDLYHSSAADTGFNFYGLRDAEIDRLLEAGRATFDETARRAVYRELQQRLYELEPLSCTFYFATPLLRDKRLLGVTPSPLDFWRTTRGPRLWRWADGPE